MTDQIFLDQMKRLESAYMYEIPVVSLKLWRQELEQENIEDSDLIAGVTYILNNPDKFTVRPNLANLLSWCGQARYNRWNKEEDKKKAGGNLSEYNSTTEHGKRALSLIQLILKGEYEKDGETHKITKRQKVDYMMKMEEFYPGQGWQNEAMGLAKYWGLN